MRTSRRDVGRLGKAKAACLLVLATALGCVSSAAWDETRKEVVDPVGQLVHHKYPQALQSMDAEVVLALFERPTSTVPKSNMFVWRHDLVTSVQSLLSGFSKIEHAECIIDSATLPTEDIDSAGFFEIVVADCDLRLDGIDKDGRRRTLEQRRKITCRKPRDGKWAILSSVALESPQETRGELAFLDETKARGIDFHPQSRGVVDRFGRTQKYLAGSGLAVGDVDGDGHDDILLVSGAELRLYRNKGDGHFEDETKKWGLDVPFEGEARMAVFADYDNCGHQDLFVGVLDGKNLLFKNDGKRFTLVDEKVSGLASSGDTTGACFADFNNDGHLDLFILNGGNLLRKDPDPIWNAKNATAAQLYLNNGDGTFRDATEKAGVGQTGWGLACTTVDYDQDGNVDLFIANDFGPNKLYRGHGDGTFEDVTEKAGITHPGANMSCCFGDVSGTGFPDLIVAGMHSNSRWIIDQKDYPVPAPWPWSVIFHDRALAIMKEMLHGNRYYRNKGDGTFQEVSSENGTFRNGWAWSSIFFDYDNDGLLDIYATNGFVSGKDTQDC